MASAPLLPMTVSDLVRLSSLCSFQGMTFPLFPMYERVASLAGNAPGKNLLGKGANWHAGAVQGLLVAQGCCLIGKV